MSFYFIKKKNKFWKNVSHLPLPHPHPIVYACISLQWEIWKHMQLCMVDKKQFYLFCLHEHDVFCVLQPFTWSSTSRHTHSIPWASSLPHMRGWGSKGDLLKSVALRVFKFCCGSFNFPYIAQWIGGAQHLEGLQVRMHKNYWELSERSQYICRSAEHLQFHSLLKIFQPRCSSLPPMRISCPSLLYFFFSITTSEITKRASS